jgi:hypothetical protein
VKSEVKAAFSAPAKSSPKIVEIIQETKDVDSNSSNSDNTVSSSTLISKVVPEPAIYYDNSNIDKHLNPFVQLLKKNNLLMNKHIPIEYMINDKETRLQLLAGFIDTDGTIKQNDTQTTYIEISQSHRLHKNLIESLDFIAKSLGYATSIYYTNDNKITKKGESRQMMTLRIMGENINEIPTLVKRKQIKFSDSLGTIRFSTT